MLKTKNLSSTQLADELGVQRSGISHILNGRNKPSLDFILRIIKKYPDISITWLLFGEGPMMNPYPVQPYGETKSKANLQKSMLELFNDQEEEAGNYFTPEAADNDKMAPLDSRNQIFIPIPENDHKDLQKKSETAKEELGLNIETIKTKEERNNSDEQLSESERRQDTTRSEKQKTIQSQPVKTERIIIFYNDRSFKEYYPD